MIRDGRRREKPGELEPAVAVRRAHHGNLDALIAQSSDTSGPFSFDRGPPFELEAEFAKKTNRPSEVFDDDSYVVHPLEHVTNLHGVAESNNGRLRCPQHRRPSRPDSLLSTSEASHHGPPQTATPSSNVSKKQGPGGSVLSARTALLAIIVRPKPSAVEMEPCAQWPSLRRPRPAC